VAKVRERLRLNKQISHRFNMEMFNLKKLNKVNGKEKYCVEVSNKFAALDKLDSEVEINSIWQMIPDTITILTKTVKVFMKWGTMFNPECSNSSDQRQKAKLHWLQDQNEINRDI
jgi:hypothetical protein